MAAVLCDVSKRASVDAAADHAIAPFEKIHVPCNNAGVSPTGALDETTAGDWEWALGVNLMGVVHGIQSIVPRIPALEARHADDPEALAQLAESRAEIDLWRAHGSGEHPDYGYEFFVLEASASE